MLLIAHITQYCQPSSTTHPFLPRVQTITTTSYTSSQTYLRRPSSQPVSGRKNQFQDRLEEFQYQVVAWGLPVEKLKVELSKKKNILIVIR